ncbi:MAG: transcription-repair coupling factor [Neomegalonema sp.]|nr:transcription-repair coupling factor [Neomegalonema sp.]
MKAAADKRPLEPGVVRVGGAPEGYDAILVAGLVARAQQARETSGPAIHVARDDRRAAAMAEALAAVAPDLPVLRFPAWDCLPYDRVSPNPEIVSERMATLAALAEGVEFPAIVLTTVNAALQRVPEKRAVYSESFAADVGGRCDLDELQGYLTRNGYRRASTVAEPGDYAIRGGVIDIFPPGGGDPLRLDLFGDVLDGARRFDAETQRTIAKTKRIELAPFSETPMDEASIQRFRRGYRESFGAAGTQDPLYAAVSSGARFQGQEHWLPLFHDRLSTLFDYLPGALICLDHQALDAAEARHETVQDHYRTRSEALEESAASQGLRAGQVYKPVPPETMFLSADDLKGLLDARPTRIFSPHRLPPGPNVIDSGGQMGRNFAEERQSSDATLFPSLAAHLQKLRDSGKKTVLATYSDGARDRLASVLSDHGVGPIVMSASWSAAQRGDGAEFEIEADPDDETAAPAKSGAPIALLVWGLEAGFETDALAVVSEQDVLGDRLIRRAKKKRRADNFLAEATSLSVGDLVVHVEHGVGRYTGLQTIDAMGAPHDCLAIEYHGGDRLYLPVENIELLTRYGSEEIAQLDKLGGGAWQAKKAKLKERIREMAEKLIHIAAQRELRKGNALAPGHGAFDEFCARFPYQETDDQLSAIDDVLNDLGSGKPMDRLVCGDVGFGKTEVAMRAAFVAASAGLQVAVIAPTTLLARQHAKNFTERFKPWPLNVRQLSRFVTTSEAKKTKEGLRDGAVDVVVGTHALLAKGIEFKNLGLLIIDEEQHFGVAHKERLKQLRADVHVLTMTATPIPRTLQLAMSGVRELSIIATPPVDRLAVRTYVAPFDSVAVREALLREKYRGGQAFWVAPRIKDLPEAEAFLREQMPEVSYVVGHGRLAAGELDERMNAFYDGAYDVLLATTIVESGLDIPTANTLIVQRADMFGLAQLYQIRGRVGRSKTRAYAYFTTAQNKTLTPAAEKRLRVLGSLDSLGAGFTLASHDLDIRGAGNLLGDEQSGHIREVGFELYQDMLEEAIAKMRAGETEFSDDDAHSWSPTINLGVPVLIPEGYVEDLDVRLGLYRRLSDLSTKEELMAFGAELHDRFGKPPKEVESLLRVVQIKGMCRRAGILKLDGGPKGATIQFRDDQFANPAGLAGFLASPKSLAKLKPDHRLSIRRNWDDPTARVKGAYALAKELAKLAEASPAPS